MQNSEELNGVDDVSPPGQREMQRLKRNAEIISASMQVFADEGYSGFSMRKVAAAAGVRLNTVQHHFGDADALLFATIRAKLDVYTERYREVALNRQLSARDRLEIALEDVFTEARQPNIARFFCEMWALAQHNEAVDELVRETYMEYQKPFAQLALEIEPSLSQAEAAVIAAMITSTTEGFAVISRFGDPDVSVSAVAVRLKAACLSLFGVSNRGMTSGLK